MFSWLILLNGIFEQRQTFELHVINHFFLFSFEIEMEKKQTIIIYTWLENCIIFIQMPVDCNRHPRYSEKLFTQILKSFVWRRHVGTHPDGLALTWLRETKRNICHCFSLRKCEFISRGVHKVNPFSNAVTFFTYLTNLLATSRKSFDIQAC